MEQIKVFLDQNPCLSEEWKTDLMLRIKEYISPKRVAAVGQQKIPVDTYMQFIEPHEGKRNYVYDDSRGIPTVGIGFNLNRKNAESILRMFGVNYQSVLDGERVSDEVIYKIFEEDVKYAIGRTEDLVPSFDRQPDEMKLVLVDMCFNLGHVGLSKFRKFLAAVDQRDYTKAASEMIDSRWYHQVGNRSKKLVGIVNGLV